MAQIVQPFRVIAMRKKSFTSAGVKYGKPGKYHIASENKGTFYTSCKYFLSEEAIPEAYDVQLFTHVKADQICKKCLGELRVTDN